ncbi:hypothetical protein J2Z48_000394 [Croceifilum oryzae]|uniref:Uncharacterized protein n=1 Tax=Croceifilum oryzae TaxID=1553429 RepID=A0AAJ1WR66_9BACL|nr:hypothetical protein [Croceifilum oryzae]MDQ0416230.1 hypothetical protein [Croceifilum oryzae]
MFSSYRSRFGAVYSDGREVEKEPDCVSGLIGEGECYLFPAHSAHKFAVSYLQSLLVANN